MSLLSHLFLSVKILPKLGNFRPIFLVGCIYKILAKILANDLKSDGKGN